jgi:hypothetical protein
MSEAGRVCEVSAHKCVSAISVVGVPVFICLHSGYCHVTERFVGLMLKLSCKMMGTFWI